MTANVLTDDQIESALISAGHVRADFKLTPQALANSRAIEQSVLQSPEVVAMRWQPIETAPKDGRTLLLGYYNSHDNWRTMRGQWMSEAYIAEHWEDPDDEQPGWFETSVEADDLPNCWPTEPTHWMPLPAPPSDAAMEVKP